jgi:hypothetical protein
VARSRPYFFRSGQVGLGVRAVLDDIAGRAPPHDREDVEARQDPALQQPAWFHLVVVIGPCGRRGERRGECEAQRDEDRFLAESLWMAAISGGTC